MATGDDAIAGFNNNDVVIKKCQISSACSAFRFGGNNILIENCNVYAPSPYQFRGSFSAEEKKASAKKSKVARNNMLCFYTNFVTDDFPAKKTSGNITVRNCTIKNADKLFHLNLSGNEPWQRGIPPTDITFENIKATNMQAGLCAYGNKNVPIQIKLKNVDFTFRNNYGKEPFIKAAHFGKISFENVKISNYMGSAL